MSENGQYVPGSLWFYAPNKGAPVFFAVAFCASTVWQLWQTYHNKCWRMTGVLVFAGTLFTAGFITREIAAFDYGNLVKLIVSVCLVYAAPPLFELANYQILGRILYYVPHLSPIHPGRVLTTFAFISSVVEALNGNGASYSTNQSLPKSKQDIGKALLKAALLIQIVVVVLFLALTVTFHRRVHAAKIRSPKLTGVLRTLYASSALIAVRTIYRIVEYFSLAELHFGPGLNPDAFGPEVRYEWFFYVFEATLMLCNASLWNVRHPRKYLPKSTKVYLARDGVTEVVGPGYKDTRSFWVTLVDPFDLKGMLGKKNGRGTTEFNKGPGICSQQNSGQLPSQWASAHNFSGCLLQAIRTSLPGHGSRQPGQQGMDSGTQSSLASKSKPILRHVFSARLHVLTGIVSIFGTEYSPRLPRNT